MKATINAQIVDYFVIPQQPDVSLMTLIGLLIPGTGNAAPVAGDVIVIWQSAKEFALVKAADWPAFATPIPQQ